MRSGARGDWSGAGSCGALVHVLGLAGGRGQSSVMRGPLGLVCGEQIGWGERKPCGGPETSPIPPRPPLDPRNAQGGLSGPCTHVVFLQRLSNSGQGWSPSPTVPAQVRALRWGPKHVRQAGGRKHSRPLHRAPGVWVDDPVGCRRGHCRMCSSVPGCSQKCIPQMFPDLAKCPWEAKRPRSRARCYINPS